MAKRNSDRSRRPDKTVRVVGVRTTGPMLAMGAIRQGLIIRHAAGRSWAELPGNGRRGANN